MRIVPILATLALAVSAATTAASAADDTPVLQLLQTPARLNIVDAGGRTVGQLVPADNGSYNLRVIGVTRTTQPAPTAAPAQSPRQSKALTPWQIQMEENTAWHNLFDPVMWGP